MPASSSEPGRPFSRVRTKAAPSTDRKRTPMVGERPRGGANARTGRINGRPLVIGCGALARELVALTRRAGFPEVELTCLPASLHNRPGRIPAAVQARIRRARADGFDRIFVAYADCGTGGQLDRVLEAEGVARLEGAHCYEVYAGRAAFAAMSDEEPGTFYLTDFLARNFERLVVRGLGLDRHPELLPLYFGNYRRLVFLAQTQDADLTRVAWAAAARLGLEFERRFVGLGEMRPAIDRFAGLSQAASKAPPASNAPKRRSVAALGPKSADFRRSTRIPDPSAAKLVMNPHQTQLRDDIARGRVAKVHPMQVNVGNVRSMQDPDVVADPTRQAGAASPARRATAASAPPAAAA